MLARLHPCRHPFPEEDVYPLSTNNNPLHLGLSRPALLAAVLAAAFFAWGSALPAQRPATPPPSSGTTLTVNARLVVLDIVVTDASGKPVDSSKSPLNVKDFQVFEDGEPQRIRSVEPPSAHALPPASLAGGPSAVFDPARPQAFGHSAVDILVLDQLNTHFADSSLARRSLHDYLARQPALLPQPATLLSVYDSRFKLLCAFTRDRDALLRALAAAPTQYAWQLEVNGKADHGPIERLDQSLRALEEIAQSYAPIPGRKNLVWVGGGFPTTDPAALDTNDAQEIKSTLQHITDVLLDTRITLYAVDPSSSAAGMTEITDPTQMAFVQAAGDAVAGAADPFNASEDFDRLGPITGGRVVRGRNDIAAQIASAVDLGANFYTLSYTPRSSSETAVQFRKIRVVCLRPGLIATTRGGYYPGQARQETSTATAAYDLTTAAESAIPLNGLRITVEPDHAPNAPPGAYIVHAGISTLTWKLRPDGSASASVYVMAASLDRNGKMLSHILHGMTASAKPGTDLSMTGPALTADFVFTVAPAPKATTLRFIVRDSATGRMGSADLPLTQHSSKP